MKDIAIFGCGVAGREAYVRLRSKCHIVSFLDNDKRRQGSRMMGVPIDDPVRYDYSRVEHIVIASMYCDEILGQLLELRVPSLKIAYSSDEVLMRGTSPDAVGSAAEDTAGWWNLSNCFHAFRRMFYVPFRLLR